MKPLSRFRIAAFLAGAMLFLVALNGQPAFGQPGETPVPNETPQEEPPPGETTATPGIAISARSSVIRRHEPGTWSALSLFASNPTEEDGEAFLSAYFAPEVSRQYARRIWIPAKSQRNDWLPLYFPAELPRRALRTSVTTLALDPAADREVLRRRQGELLTSDLFATLDHEASQTMTYFRNPLPDERNRIPDLDGDAYDTVAMARVCAELSPILLNFEGSVLPSWAETLQGFDQIALAGDRILNDTAGLVTLRTWVRDGGRLWIMVDRVSPATLAAILGNANKLEVVDRVELDHYEIDAVDSFSRIATKDVCDFEVPVEFVRVLTTTGEIPCKINGWPAAIWLPYGEGEILLTMLGPRGWRGEKEKVPTSALRNLATHLFSGRPTKIDATGFRPALQANIGYEIPRRSFAMTVLGTYCLCLLGCGLILFKTGRLDWLAWVVPVITLVAAGTLFGVGAANAHSVKPMIAYGQLLRVAPQTNELRVDGLAAIYDQQTREIDLHGTRRNWLLPDPPKDKEVRRIIWNDDDATQTQNATTLASSVGLAREMGIYDLPQRISLRAAFGPEGLAGKVDVGNLVQPSDWVIAWPPSPASSVTIGTDGTLVARPDQTLAIDQYTADTILSDEQRRRQDVFRWLLNPADPIQFPQTPTLLFWCDPIDSGVTLPEGFAKNGTALASVPIELQRTPTKTAFQIPATFLRAEVAAGKQGKSTAYDPRTGKWVKGLTSSSETLLRYQFPNQVLPCRFTGGTFIFRINAPSREVQVIGHNKGSEPVLINSYRNPNGVFEVKITAEQLVLDDQGGITVGLNVSQTDQQRAKQGAANVPVPAAGGTASAPGPVPATGSPVPSLNPTDTSSDFDNSSWQIDYVRMTVSGETL